MSDLFDRLAQLSPEKRALLARRLAEAGTSAPPATEPVAIVGLSCRFPGGADSPDAFWRVLAGGVDVVTEVPADRWDSGELFDADPAAAGKVATRWGGFLRSVDRFDPYFFGISPREAARMDPQQRLWLEVAFEAFEHAGLTLDALAGSATGVFLGLHSHSSDYFWLQLADPAQMDAFTGPGNAHNIAAGRLAYLFDLRGPAITVDTACSSSLVAVHMACQSLRAGDCRIAIAGGVNAMLSPLWSIPLSRMQMLSPTGRCRAFDASADGFVRGEGAGAVILKRLSDAVADDDTILAVIRGSAVNQDGRTNGITAPNGLAQRALLRDALRNAGVRAGDITHVETHGTGTALGDPIELEAIADVLGEGRSAARQCWIGAVKSNLGHLEGAAGIAGLIKVVLSLQRRAIPPVVHFSRLNPHIAVDVAQFPVPTRVEPWPGDRRLAGVSSFGWSGTNAHIIVEQAPAAPAPDEVTLVAPHVLAVSARSRESLHEQVSRYREFLAEPGAGALAAVCRTAALRRSHHEYRVAAVGDSTAEIADSLNGWLTGQRPWTVVEGRARAGRAPAVAFVFSGQGPQWPGMGRELLDPAFRDALERCDSLIAPVAGWSVLEELSAPPERSRLDRTEFAQPAIFALQVALAELLRAWGLQPGFVVGHSVGEIAAAWCAGALALEDAARVAVVRGRVMDRATGFGRMLSAELSADEARTFVEDWRGLSIAAINGPRSLVLSGDADAVERAAGVLSARGVSARYLPVNYAFHSAHMDDVANEVARELGDLPVRDATVPMISTVTGAACEARAVGAAYWGRNVRQTVRFADAIDRLARQHQPVFVEIGPHPVLKQSVVQTIEAAGLDPQIVETLHRGRPAAGSMRASLAALHALGCDVNWRALYPGRSRPMALPAYAWQRERYWLDHIRPYSPDRQRAAGQAAPVAADGAIADWLYEPVWLADASAQGSALDSAPGAWLVLADRAGVAARLIGELEKRGHTCVVLLAHELLRGDSPDAIAKGLRSACEKLGASDRSWRGIVHLWSLDASADDETDAAAILDSQRASCAAMVAIVQTLLALGKAHVPVWVATRGAHPVEAGTGRLAPSQAPVWGLARTLSIEHPGTRCVRLDLPDGIDAGVEALLTEIAQSGSEDQVGYRNGTRFIARLRRIEPSGKPRSVPSPLRADATYLITGGLGALGRATAHWMVGRGARRLVVASRSAASASVASFLDELRREGAEVHVARADMSREADVRELFADVAASGFPLKGIVHAAGVLDDGVLAQQTWPRLRAVLAPKVAGAWNLHAASRSLDLDFFVLYSSLAGLLGSAGQASYAAANAFLDALAHGRRAAGLPALSINWGVWDRAGMAAALDEGSRRRLTDAGIAPMDPDDALAGLEWALASAKPQVAVMSVDWRKYIAYRNAQPAFLAGIDPSLASAATTREPSLLDALQAAAPERRKAVVLDYVRRQALAVLGVPAGHAIDNDQGLRDAGLDSLMALELKNRLQTSVGQPLPATLAFDFPTIAALAQHLSEGVLRLGNAQPRGAAAAAPAVVDLSNLTEDEAARMLADELAALQRERTGSVLSGSKGSRRYTHG